MDQTAGNTIHIQNDLKIIKIFSGYTLKKLKASNFHGTKQRKTIRQNVQNSDYLKANSSSKKYMW